MGKKDTNSKIKLEEFGKLLVSQIQKERNPTINFPLRALSNVKFNEKTKTLELGNKRAERSFFNVAHAKKFLQTVEAASISKNLTELGKNASLRDVFYQMKRTIAGTNINIVDEQQESDIVIEDLELITGLFREQLHINANKNGSIAGRVIIEDKGDVLDWSRMGSGGWSIPSNVEHIEFKKVSADYVLYMEKAGVWERLHEDRFWDKQKCVIVSSQGQTTRGIRRLLQRLSDEHNLPTYVLTDLDPWGFYIYSVIKYGSINLAHISERMTIPSVKFLGITVDDIKNYKLEKHLIKFNETDIKRLKQISEYDWFKNNKKWQEQFKELKGLGAKAEIQALSSKGISFISDKYLPEKIKAKDFFD